MLLSIRKVKDAAIKLARSEMMRGHARLDLIHRRPYDLDERRGIYMMHEESREIVEEPRRTWRDVATDIIDQLLGGKISQETAYNLILNAGRVQMHLQVYGTTSLGTNGFNYIAWTNDATAPAAGDTTLTSEIATNGLTRAQGTVTLAAGSGNQTTVDKVFSVTGTQSAQKTALFDASSTGHMNHEIAFTPRSLANGDTLEGLFTLTLG